ncbi:hypothetical protein [uncultured Draconibacterium sp.]|uniref:hypothetical protein n=1 Tax=uncultured Draconibacterium sp. TaxID=1573823 RepID=UPI003217E298
MTFLFLKRKLHTYINIKKIIDSHKLVNEHKPFNSYARVYHHHLMKTGGTSLNHMFLNLSSTNNENLYNKLMASSDLRIINNRWVFSAWNQSVIRSGLFHYAWSHRPFDKLHMPEKTFIFSCFRDPQERIFSRYNHLKKEYNSTNPRKDINKEYQLLGNCFEDYLKNIPKQEICHQLYMFSTKLDLNEALARLFILNYIVTLNTFESDIDNLNSILNINLHPIHIRRSNNKENNLSQTSINCIKNHLQSENDFFKYVIELKQLINDLSK